MASTVGEVLVAGNGQATRPAHVFETFGALYFVATGICNREYEHDLPSFTNVPLKFLNVNPTRRARHTDPLEREQRHQFRASLCTGTSFVGDFFDCVFFFGSSCPPSPSTSASLSAKVLHCSPCADKVVRIAEGTRITLSITG